MSPGSPCCPRLAEEINQSCDQHPEPGSCPDHVIGYRELFDEYGLWIHDGEGDRASAMLNIVFCPFCGAELPPSRRDEWFARLEARELDPEDAPPDLLRPGWWARP